MHQKDKQLKCEVCAYPAVHEYLWTYVNGEAIHEGITSSEDGSIITISEVRASDFTTYQCTAINIVNGQEKRNVFDIEMLERGEYA